MDRLKSQIVSFLNLGLNPTVVCFPGDGVPELCDLLLKGRSASNSYDPEYSFLHVSLRYLNDASVNAIEDEINQLLTRDEYEGDTIYETSDLNVEVVCILDDIAFIDNPHVAIRSADTLLKKYRGRLHFVYVVESVDLLERLREYVRADSAVLEAVIYQQVGQGWTPKQLTEKMQENFKRKLDPKDIKQILRLSARHYGLYKRLYQDAVLETETSELYAHLLLRDLKAEVLSALHTLRSGERLTGHVSKIISVLIKLGVVTEDGHMTIPILEDNLTNVPVHDAVSLSEKGKLIGVDLGLLTPTDRELLEVFLAADGSIITRDYIATVLWGDDAFEKYSEWAIDQRIARLRKKLKSIGSEYDIKTEYGKGYSLIKRD